MKKITVLAALALASFSVNANELLPNTEYEVKIDQSAYERVFIACVSSFKGPEKTTFNDLNEAIETCEESAKKIAMRSKYVGSDNTEWKVTITPIEEKK